LVFSQSRNELKLGSVQAKIGSVANIPLTLSTTDQVQGLVAVYEWDSTAGTGEGLVAGTAITTADTVVTRVESGFMVLGVVMDSDGAGGEIINPGNDLLIATAQIRCANQVGLADVVFVDGKHPAAAGGPLLDNIIVVGGLSVDKTGGLILTKGHFDCLLGVNTFRIDSANASNTSDRCGDAKVLMENISPVEGYVVALCHDPAVLTLDSIAVGAAATAQAADFSASDIFPNGGTLGVVMDLTAPFTNNTIPVGDANHIASYRYCCNSPPTSGPGVATPLTFCDNTLGTPLKENVIVVGGLSVNPKLENGTFTCKPTQAAGENCNNGIDDDGDGKIDAADADCQQMFACGARAQDVNGIPGPIQGSVGAPVEVCFFIKSPEDNAAGHAQFDHIQGFSMALTYCCNISASETFDVSGTIVEAVGAEFISAQADNDPNDGDECELIIGVLVDALPPFDGQTIPPIPTLQRVGCLQFVVKDDVRLCGTCCDIKFKDGVNGRGKVPIKNLISVENVSRGPQTVDCKVCIFDKERFFRGDCNFSQRGADAVDIADAASVVSFLFMPGTFKFAPPCLDACDCNDDGRIDLADAVCILQYLFLFGSFPPDPGPGIQLTGEANPRGVAPRPAGVDPTDDKLDCKAGNQCTQ
jgi:hypothetical protein